MDNPTACFLFSLIFKPKGILHVTKTTSVPPGFASSHSHTFLDPSFKVNKMKWQLINGLSERNTQVKTDSLQSKGRLGTATTVTACLPQQRTLCAQQTPHQHNPCLLHSKAVAGMELAGKQFQSHKVATPIPHWDDKYDFSPSGHYQRMTQIHTQSKTKQEPRLYLIILLLGDQCVLQLSARLLSAQKSSNRKTRSQLLITTR